MALSQRELRRKAPYAPIRNVREVLQRLRDRGLQIPVTLDTLQVLGVPEGNTPRTLQALKFLGIVADDGLLEEAAERLHRATTEEYPKLLEEIIRKAYAPVWEVADPAVSNEVQIADAFRQYDPAAQRPRMVTLFLGLCAEAGIIQPSQSTPTATRRAASRLRRGRPAQRVSRPEPYSTVTFVPETDSPIPERGTPLFGVKEEDLSLLDDAQFKQLWDALGMVARERSKKRAVQAAAPKPKSFTDAFFDQQFKEKEPTEGQ